MTGQLDLFHQPAEPAVAADEEAAVRPSLPLTELPGSTFEDLFPQPEEAT